MEKNASTSTMLLLPIVFLAAASLLLYLASSIVFEALAVIFGIGGGVPRIALGTALGVLSGGFVVTTILGVAYYNVFTRWLYAITAVWIGFFAYLSLACVAYALIVAIWSEPLREVGMLCVAVAVFLAAYGLVSARKIAVREVKIAMPGLPDAWSERKAVWISDLHLGQLLGPDFARRVVDKVNALPHDIVFIGGDLFDNTGLPDLAELAAPLARLVAPLGAYFITGNHEEFGNGERSIAAVRGAHVHPLIDEKIEIDGMQLAGVDFRSTYRKRGFLEVLARLAIDRSRPSILLKHEPKDLDLASAAGVSLCLSGHTHRGQLWPSAYLTQLFYKGFAYGLMRLGDMQVYVSSGVGTWGPPMRVGANAEIVRFTFVRERGSG